MLFYFYLLFPTVFFLIALLLGFITPSYNPIKEPISMLAITPNGIWQTLNFITCGFFILLLGSKIKKLPSPVLIKKIVGNVIALVGILLVLLAFFPTDLSFIPVTIHGFIHVLFFLIIVFVFLIGELMVGIKVLKKNKFYAGYSLFSLAVSLTAVILMLAFQNYLGLFQRVFVITVVLWFTISPLIIKQKVKSSTTH